MESIENGTTRLSYPFMFNPITLRSHPIALNLGGLSFINNYTVHESKGLQLAYFTATHTEEERERGELWQSALIKRLVRDKINLNFIRVNLLTFQSIIQETKQNIDSIMPQFGGTLILMILFSACSTITRDWKSSKPFVALVGILSAFLGGISAFGLLAYFGIPYAQTCLSVPFILLGIGVDDCFVLLSAWSRTSIKSSISTRLALSYQEVGVSITITSLTDVLSFYVGLLTPIESIQVFCAFAGTSVIGMYIFQLIFFGAILALSGEQENGKRHSTIWFILNSETTENTADDKQDIESDNRKCSENSLPPAKDDSFTASSFRDYYVNFVCNKYIQIGVIGIFVTYIAISCWGLQFLEEGFKEENSYNYNSYVYDFYTVQRKYFMEYPYRIQVAITTPMDYSLPQNQYLVKRTLETLIASSKYIVQDYKEDWLEEFLNYIDRYKELYEFDIANETKFIQTLRKEFLNRDSVYNLDVIFNLDKTKILATRYILQAKNLYSSNDVKIMLTKLRSSVKEAQENGLDVTIYHPWFKFADQILIIRPLTIKLVLIAAAIVTITTFIFVPNFTTVLTVLVIASIELGVLGLMSFLGMYLEFISLIVIVMCIGFSIDFSSHISYSYISNDGKSSEERIRNTLSCLGLPIIQGSISTIIGVLGLAFANSYLFTTFFKIVFLCVILSLFHSLLVLPVLLILLKPETYYSKIFHILNFCGHSKMKASDVKEIEYSPEIDMDNETKFGDKK